MLPPRRPVLFIGFIGVLLCWAQLAAAQTFDTVGTRAAGMGGAFVAVADDASAAYWNPGGFASGNYFTMVLDRNTAKIDPGGPAGAASESGLLVSLGMPALGLSYYRLRSSTLTPALLPTQSSLQPAGVRVDTLITHHSGVTLVQSIAHGIAVGTTLKIVRGVAGSTLVVDEDRDRLLQDVQEPTGKGRTRFDADIGVMVATGTLKAGITVRNITEPAFPDATGSRSLSLRRQARAGIAMTIVEGWALAADLDLTRGAGPTGPERDFAAGTEARIARKAFVRGGFRVNTAGAGNASLSAGASYALMGSVLMDGQVTGGSQKGQLGWGVAARFVY